MFKNDLALVTFKDWLAETIEERGGHVRDVELGVLLTLLRSEPYGEAVAMVKRYLCAEIRRDKYSLDHSDAEEMLVKLADIEADIDLYDWDSVEEEEPLPFQDPDDQEPDEDPEGEENEDEEVDQ